MHGWDIFAKGGYGPLYRYLEDGTPDVRRWRPTAPTPTPRPGSSLDYPGGPQDRSAAAVGRLCVRGRVFSEQHHVCAMRLGGHEWRAGRSQRCPPCADALGWIKCTISNAEFPRLLRNVAVW
jgi:hypothetical protein